MTATTFRTDTVAGILGVLNAYITAHPAELLRAYPARPESLADLPAAFIENRPESITHDSGTRTRTMSPSVVVVRRITDNEEAMTAFDSLIDGLVDAFTAVPQFAADTIWSAFTVADEEYAFGDYIFAAVRFTFTNITAMEGRA
jgi:hypothetical protein